MNNPSQPPVLDPAVQKLLDEFASTPGPKIHELPVEDARHVFLDMQSISIPKLPADIEDHTLPIGPRGSVLIRIVKPQGIAGPLPAVMYFHGGGWVVGDRETHDRLLRELANGANAAIVFVEYSRSPESCYPIANEEAYAATQWIAEHGDELGIDSNRLALAEIWPRSYPCSLSSAAVPTLTSRFCSAPPWMLPPIPSPIASSAPDTRSTSKPWNGSGTIISPLPRCVLSPPPLPCELPCSNWQSCHPR